MAEKSLAQIQQELLQIRQELSGEQPRTGKNAGGASGRVESYPLFDLGFFLLAYLFWLVVVSNILLAFGIPISQYNCILAVPPAWATLWITRRKRMLHTLLITLCGMLVILGCAYAASLVIDLGWDSNWYHKVDTGLLAHGWNPFTMSMGDYANQSGLITTVSDWDGWFDGYPKASYTIGACFYTLFGTINAGKCFHFLAAIIVVCMGTTLLQQLGNGKLKSHQAFLIAFLLAFNPTSITQCMGYYNDGFLAAMLTTVMLSLCYLTYHQTGALALPGWIAVVMATSIGVNTKFSGLISFGILGLLFYAYWIYRHTRTHDLEKSLKFCGHLTLFFVGTIICAFCITGATTYITNTLRYGNPIYSVIGEGATPALVSNQAPAYLRTLSNFGMFIQSVFSHITNGIAGETENLVKFPFTFSADDWASAASIETRAGGWGVFFSGVFVLSLMVMAAGLITAFRNRSQRHFGSLILLVLVFVFIPPVFFEGYWWARFYVQLFWIPAFALFLLFTAFRQKKRGSFSAKRILTTLCSYVLAALLLADIVPGLIYAHSRILDSNDTKANLTSMELQSGLYTYQLSFYMNAFYGMLFDVMDHDIDYSVVVEADTENLRSYGSLYVYTGYFGHVNEQGKPQTLPALVEMLHDNMETTCILIAAANTATQAPDTAFVQAIQSLGLAYDVQEGTPQGYLAVIDGGIVQTEQSGADILTNEFTLDGLPVALVCYTTEAEAAAEIDINYFMQTLNTKGMMIVVYDYTQKKLIDAVNIDPYTPSLTLSR